MGCVNNDIFIYIFFAAKYNSFPLNKKANTCPENRAGSLYFYYPNGWSNFINFENR